MTILHVLRVFVGEGGAGGNPLGVFLEGREVPEQDRQKVAGNLGFSETVFVEDPGRGELRIFTPTTELPFAGHPLVGTAWLLAREGAGASVLRPPAGEVSMRTEDDFTYIFGRPEWAPPFEHVELDSPAAVDELTGPPDGYDLVGAWAWEDEEMGHVRACVSVAVWHRGGRGDRRSRRPVVCPSRARDPDPPGQGVFDPRPTKARRDSGDRGTYRTHRSAPVPIKEVSIIEADKRTYEHILYESDDTLALVTMNRPKKRNALSLDHMQELIDCLKAIGETGEAPVVVLRGSGPAFCAGHDLSEMVGRDPEFYRHLFDVCCELMQTIQAIPQPVIAQVHGVATAAGCQLAATCDLVVASEDARFATPGVKIGLFCSTPMVALSRSVGQKKAMEMLLTGEFISAEEALAEGLVNKVVPAEQLETETRTLAEKIAEASPLVVGVGKQAFYRQLEMPIEQAYAYTREVMSFNATFADAQEGICAFLEKRKPEWKGR